MVSGETFPKIRKFVANKVVGTPDGSQPKFRLIAELHFDSMEDIQAAVAAESAQKAVAHAFEISVGRSAGHSGLRRGREKLLSRS